MKVKQIEQRLRVPAVDVPDLYRDICDVNLLSNEGVFGGVRRTNLINNSNIPTVAVNSKVSL